TKSIHAIIIVEILKLPDEMSDLEDFDHVLDENNGSGFIAKNSGRFQLWKRDIKANGILICWPIIAGPSRGMLHRFCLGLKTTVSETCPREQSDVAQEGTTMPRQR
ncbi:hypothetical protein L9F63_024110, partial [Diploptera punctata]